MPSIRFANVLMEITPRALSYPTMYYHTNQPVRVNPDTHEWFVEGAGTIDFTTYFNSLSTMKLLKYTRATGFHLHLEVKGNACTITQTKAYRLSSSPEIDPTVFAKVQASNKWQSIDLDLTVDENMVLAGFQIETTGAIVVRDAYYTLDIDGELTDIELSLDHHLQEGILHYQEYRTSEERDSWFRQRYRQTFPHARHRQRLYSPLQRT